MCFFFWSAILDFHNAMHERPKQEIQIDEGQNHKCYFKNSASFRMHFIIAQVEKQFIWSYTHGAKLHNHGMPEVPLNKHDKVGSKTWNFIFSTLKQDKFKQKMDSACVA